MRLYACENARLITPDDHILGGKNTPGYKLLIPVPFFILEHPSKGVVLFDAGVNPDHAPEEMRASISTSSYYSVLAYLNRLGYTAGDVKYVVMSHLHFDHSGYMCDFPQATFCMRKSEWSAAVPPSRHDYILADYLPAQQFHFEYIPEDVDYDLFGDGSVICLDTKGHSPGHQSFLISMPKEGKILLTVDAAHMKAFFDDSSLLDEAWNKEMALKALEKIKAYEKNGVKVILGHDPDVWATVKKFPEYYE